MNFNIIINNYYKIMKKAFSPVILRNAKNPFSPSSHFVFRQSVRPVAHTVRRYGVLASPIAYCLLPIASILHSSDRLNGDQRQRPAADLRFVDVIRNGGSLGAVTRKENSIACCGIDGLTVFQADLIEQLIISGNNSSLIWRLANPS